MSAPPRPSPLTPQGFFVTGTDTGVGKTLVTCALLHAFAARGLRVTGMKPVAAGAVATAEGLINDDVEQLRAAGNIEVPRALLNPYCFEPPIAPHIAAAAAGVEIDLARIVHACRELRAMADVVVVEGAGGFCVPLDPRQDSADLAQQLDLPVVLVVGLRLGCINHALLSAQAIRAHGLMLAGWVANRIDPHMTAAAENIVAIEQRLQAPLLAKIDYCATPQARRIAESLNMHLLI